MTAARTAPSRAIQARFLRIAFCNPLKFRTLHTFYAIQGGDEGVRLAVIAERRFGTTPLLPIPAASWLPA